MCAQRFIVIVFVIVIVTTACVFYAVGQHFSKGSIQTVTIVEIEEHTIMQLKSLREACFNNLKLVSDY
jgi:hypothetical protein